MASGSNTRTTSDREHVAETKHGESVYRGDWITWKRSHPKSSKLIGPRFGKVVRRINGYHIICIPTSMDLRESWDLEEFAWAVAEGRISAESIKILNEKLANHEWQYAQRSLTQKIQSMAMAKS